MNWTCHHNTQNPTTTTPKISFVKCWNLNHVNYSLVLSIRETNLGLRPHKLTQDYAAASTILPDGWISNTFITSEDDCVPCPAMARLCTHYNQGQVMLRPLRVFLSIQFLFFWLPSHLFSKSFLRGPPHVVLSCDRRLDDEDCEPYSSLLVSEVLTFMSVRCRLLLLLTSIADTVCGSMPLRLRDMAMHVPCHVSEVPRSPSWSGLNVTLNQIRNLCQNHHATWHVELFLPPSSSPPSSSPPSIPSCKPPPKTS